MAGEGREVPLVVRSSADRAACPVQALRDWLAEETVRAGISEDRPPLGHAGASPPRDRNQLVEKGLAKKRLSNRTKKHTVKSIPGTESEAAK
jgi:hypothetical protein